MSRTWDFTLSLYHVICKYQPLAKAEFGWCMYDPPLNECEKIDGAIRRALREPKQSCVELRNIFRGHRLNLRFRILTACVNALHRTYQATPFPTWHRDWHFCHHYQVFDENVMAAGG